MCDGVKINYRTEFPRIGAVLVIEAQGEVATIRVTNSVNGEMMRMEKFEDFTEAMNYYSEQFSNLKSAEEFEVMRVMLEMVSCVSEGE